MQAESSNSNFDGLYNSSLVMLMTPEVCLDRAFQNVVRVGIEVLVGRPIKGMERTVQVLAAHCVLKRCSDLVANPGTKLVPALSFK